MITRSVEVLRTNGSPLCSLPDLPDDRHYHTQSGLMACGGGSDSTSLSCVSLSPGGWSKTHDLYRTRFKHSAWSSGTPHLILMGGPFEIGITTEILTVYGTSQEHFQLKYDTKYSFIHYFYKNSQFLNHNSQACTIELEDQVIVTGGISPSNVVHVYDNNGWLMNLPDLKQGRNSHACGHYVDHRNNLVRGCYEMNLIMKQNKPR